MSIRNISRMLLRNSSPFIFASLLFTDTAPPEKPSENEKLQLKTLNVKHLSYDHMIKQSTINAVNSATETLTVTYMAIGTASNEYRSLLNKLITLLQETLEFEIIPDSHWDEIVETRVEMQHKKQVVTQLINYVDYVHKMAVAVSEISYLSGMDNLAGTMCERINDTVKKVKEQVNDNQTLEEEYTRIQQACIIKTNVKENLEEEEKNKP